MQHINQGHMTNPDDFPFWTVTILISFFTSGLFASVYWLVEDIKSARYARKTINTAQESRVNGCVQRQTD